jgi:phosphate:Na+ symporter
MRPGSLFRAAREPRPFPLTLAAALFLLSPGVAWADSLAVSLASPDWFVMAMGLLGGLALFLFGMEQMSDALKAVAGDQMKVLLTRLT